MRWAKPRRALTLVEAMLLLVIVSIVAVAAGVGLQAVAKVPATVDATMAVNNVMVSVMEQTRANLEKNWPTTTWGGANYAFIAEAVSYTPTAGTSIGTTGSPSAGYATPTSGASPAPVTINNMTYQLTVSMDEADPAGGTSYQPDLFQVTVKVCPILSGTVNTNSPQTMVTYVAQP